MTPSLEYSQAIHGIATDAAPASSTPSICVEVARAIEVLRKGGALAGRRPAAVRAWFSD